MTWVGNWHILGNMLSVMFCGAARTVTGSQYFLEYTTEDGSKFRFCLDSGMFQVGKKLNLIKINSHLLFDPKQLDCLVLTHGHLDHCGRIPYLVRMGFGGRIYSTPATKQIAEVVMRDAARHQGEGGITPDISDIVGQENIHPAKADQVESGFAERVSVGLRDRIIDPENYRLFTEVEVDMAVGRFRTHNYHKPFLIHPNLQVEFFDAGHILGSAWVTITEVSTGRKIVFSGDLGNVDKPIIEDPEMPCCMPTLTHIFTETTYGNRVHGKLEPKEKLRKIAKETLRRGGKLLIPSFSVERAQEVIYYLVELMRDGKIERVPIYLDSPMASKILEICLSHPELYDKDMQTRISENANPLIYRNLEILETVDESKKLNNFRKPCIIIAGSGMLNGGRILKHLQFHLDNPLHTLLFVGYQAVGTLGREILDGAKEVEVEEKIMEVKVQIETINEFSAHADQRLLKKWVVSMVQDIQDRVPMVFLMHGEKEASLALGNELMASMPGKVATHWPRFGERVVLWD